MSASADLQNAVRDVLKMDGRLSVPIEIISRRTKDLAAEIEASAANSGLCIYVMPPLPQQATQGGSMLFYESVEVRVRIVERPAINGKGIDAYELIDEVSLALHWQPHFDLESLVDARMASASEDEATASAYVAAQRENAPLVALAAILTAHPIRLAARCSEEAADQEYRIIDVIFECQYGLQRPA